jgi:hypothetical protein
MASPPHMDAAATMPVYVVKLTTAHACLAIEE